MFIELLPAVPHVDYCFGTSVKRLEIGPNLRVRSDALFEVVEQLHLRESLSGFQETESKEAGLDHAVEVGTINSP